MESLPVTIIIPVWNLWETTRACLVSLRKNTPPEIFRVLVVDNGSADDTEAKLQELGGTLFPGHFTRLRLPENEGFARACNRGARAADTPFVLFLNNDTLAEKGWLEPLLSAMGGCAALAGAGPLLLYPEGRRVQHCGITLSPVGTFTHIYRHFPASHPAVRKARPLQALTGAALLLRREEFLACGGFFEGFANGFEDIDLCARLAAGNRHFRCVSESVVLHLESRTPGRNKADMENYALLRARSLDRFIPDMQRIAGEDGLRLCLNENLEPVLRIPESEARALSCEAAKISGESGSARAERLSALLDRHPAWQEGYGQLAAALAGEAPPGPQQALAALHLEALLFPGPEVMRRLLAMAERLNSPALRLFASRRLGEYGDLAAHAPAFRRRAEKERARAETLGFDDTAALLAGWMAAPAGTDFPCSG